MTKWLCGLLLALSNVLFAEINWQADTQPPFALHIRINSQQVSIDENLQLEATFQYPSSYRLDQDDLLEHLTWSANPLAPQLALEAWAFTPQPGKDEQQTLQLKATLRPLITGTIALSLLVISFQPKDQKQPPYTIVTPIFNIEVFPFKAIVPLSLAPLAPLTPQFPLGLSDANRNLLIDNPERLAAEMQRNQQLLALHTFPWFTAMMLLGLGGIGWIAYLLRDRWMMKKAAVLPVLTPQEKVAQALGHLAGKETEGKFYYAGLTDVLTVALQERLKGTLTGMTTEEIGRYLAEVDLDPAIKDKIEAFLTEVDQVKFAQKEATTQQAGQAREQLQALVEQLLAPESKAPLGEHT